MLQDYIYLLECYSSISHLHRVHRLVSTGPPVEHATVPGSQVHLLPLCHLVLQRRLQHLADRPLRATGCHGYDRCQSNRDGAAVHDVTEGTSHAERLPRCRLRRVVHTSGRRDVAHVRVPHANDDPQQGSDS